MFESHVTISPTTRTREFTSICRKLSLKPILIEEDSGSNFIKQIMTAKFHHTNNVETALGEMHEIAAKFTELDVEVIRRKLEQIVGWKSVEREEFSCKLLYEEFHSKFIVENDFVREFIRLVRQSQSHYARNLLKDSRHIFVTSRHREVHKSTLDTLRGLGYTLLNTIAERVVYDDLPSMDIMWSPCNECMIKKEISL